MLATVGDLVNDIVVRLSGPVNVATGEQTAIRDLAATVAEAAGFEGEIDFDTSMPAGQPGRRFSTRRVEETGWRAEVSLSEGLAQTVAWFEANRETIRER